MSEPIACIVPYCEDDECPLDEDTPSGVCPRCGKHYAAVAYVDGDVATKADGTRVDFTPPWKASR
jgi:hypothetical protein